MAPKVTPLLSYALFFLSLVLFHAMLVMGDIPSSSSFNFIKLLQGSKKGDKVEGLYNLKKYLKTFGYIDNLSYNNSFIEADYFSDQLESAVKTYQANFNLNSTGVLDANTVSQMVKPRCGVADIINGTNWMRRGEVVPNYAFFPNRLKWPNEKNNLKYGLARGTPLKFYIPVANAFKDWHKVSHFKFHRAPFHNADLTFQLFKGEHGDGHPFDGPGGSYAHSFPPTDGICHFDGEENWAEFGPPHNGLDIQSIALHEIGHLLGLDHSAVPQSVMWPTFEYGEKKRELHHDDIQGLRLLYSDSPY